MTRTPTRLPDLAPSVAATTPDAKEVKKRAKALKKEIRSWGAQHDYDKLNPRGRGGPFKSNRVVSEPTSKNTLRDVAVKAQKFQDFAWLPNQVEQFCKFYNVETPQQRMAIVEALSQLVRQPEGSRQAILAFLRFQLSFPEGDRNQVDALVALIERLAHLPAGSPAQLNELGFVRADAATFLHAVNTLNDNELATAIAISSSGRLPLDQWSQLRGTTVDISTVRDINFQILNERWPAELTLADRIALVTEFNLDSRRLSTLYYLVSDMGGPATMDEARYLAGLSDAQDTALHRILPALRRHGLATPLPQPRDWVSFAQLCTEGNIVHERPLRRALELHTSGSAEDLQQLRTFVDLLGPYSLDVRRAAMLRFAVTVGPALLPEAQSLFEVLDNTEEHERINVVYRLESMDPASWTAVRESLLTWSQAADDVAPQMRLLVFKLLCKVVDGPRRADLAEFTQVFTQCFPVDDPAMFDYLASHALDLVNMLTPAQLRDFLVNRLRTIRGANESWQTGATQPMAAAPLGDFPDMAAPQMQEFLSSVVPPPGRDAIRMYAAAHKIDNVTNADDDATWATVSQVHQSDPTRLNLKCMISLNHLADLDHPVFLIRDNAYNVFEYEYIKQWWAETGKCPATRAEFALEDLRKLTPEQVRFLLDSQNKAS